MISEEQKREALALKTPATLGDLARTILALRESQDRIILAQAKKRKALEDRIALLEARPALAYAGVWKQDEEAQAGFFYTAGGSIWYCHQRTRQRPGESSAWQLAVKSGRDGKDAR